MDDVDNLIMDEQSHEITIISVIFNSDHGMRLRRGFIEGLQAASSM